MSTKKESMSGSSSSLWFIVAVLALIALIGMSTTFKTGITPIYREATNYLAGFRVPLRITPITGKQL